MAPQHPHCKKPSRGPDAGEHGLWPTSNFSKIQSNPVREESSINILGTHQSTYLEPPNIWGTEPYRLVPFPLAVLACSLHTVTAGVVGRRLFGDLNHRQLRPADLTHADLSETYQVHPKLVSLFGKGLPVGQSSHFSFLKTIILFTKQILYYLVPHSHSHLEATPSCTGTLATVYWQTWNDTDRGIPCTAHQYLVWACLGMRTDATVQVYGRRHQVFRLNSRRE